MVARRGLFLDRDGVVNDLVPRDGGWFSPLSRDTFVLSAGISDAIKYARSIGYEIVIITNQPEIARGRLDWRTFLSMSDLIKHECGPVEIYVCPHDSSDKCECRKPKPGLLEQAVSDLDLAKETSVLIGDRRSDVDAALKAGIKPYLMPSRQTEEGWTNWPDCTTIRSPADIPEVLDLD